MEIGATRRTHREVGVLVLVRLGQDFSWKLDEVFDTKQAVPGGRSRCAWAAALDIE